MTKRAVALKCPLVIDASVRWLPGNKFGTDVPRHDAGEVD